MQEIDLIAVDLDGTLLNNKSQVSKENLVAIHELNKLGVFVVPCTGRAMSEIPVCLKENEDIKYIIYSNGSGLFDAKNKKCVSVGLNKQTANEILDILSNYDAHLVVRYGGNSYAVANKDVDHLEKYFNFVFSHTDVIKKHVIFKEDFDVWKYQLENVEVLSAFFHNFDEKIECKKRVEKIDGVSVVEASEYNIEAVNESAGKGNGVLRLAKQLNIDIKNVAGIGDSDNDFQMMEKVGISFAVLNATDALKSACDAVICSNDDSVMEYVLNNFYPSVNK